ncbi:MAG: type II secretion system F family protein [Alphaproteobacteria bacterium]
MNMIEQLIGISPQFLIVTATGVIAFVTVVAVWQGLLVRDPLAVRARALGQYRDTLKSKLLKSKSNSFNRVETMTLMRSIIQRLNLLKGEHVAKVTALLMQAGWRSKDAVVAFLFFKLSLPFVFGGLGLFLVFSLTSAELAPIFKILTAMVGVVVGAYGPDIFVKNAIQKRRVQLQKGLPDTLDLLVICAEAGLALDAALTRVASEMRRSSPELSDEIGLTAVELGFQPERRTALENLVKRTNLPSIRGVVNTLLQTEKYGTPLAQSLRVLAAEYRDDRMLKAEEKAAKLPATLTIPLIMFILPTLFIVLLGPAILRAIDGLGGL